MQFLPHKKQAIFKDDTDKTDNFFFFFGLPTACKLSKQIKLEDPD